MTTCALSVTKFLDTVENTQIYLFETASTLASAFDAEFEWDSPIELNYDEFKDTLMLLASIDARVIFEIFDYDKNQVLDILEMDDVSIFIRAKMSQASPIIDAFTDGWSFSQGQSCLLSHYH